MGAAGRNGSLRLFQPGECLAGGFVNSPVRPLAPPDPPTPSNSTIHKATGLTASWPCLVWFLWSEQISIGCSPETVLCGDRQTSGFVNRAVNLPHPTHPLEEFCVQFWSLFDGHDHLVLSNSI